MANASFVVTLVKEANWKAYRRGKKEDSTAGLCTEEFFSATSKADAYAQARAKFPGYFIDEEQTIRLEG